MKKIFKSNKKSSLIPIKDLNLSVRPYNCLISVNVNTLTDLLSMSLEEINNVKNLGASSYKEIIEKVDKYFLNNSITNFDIKCQDKTFAFAFRILKGEKINCDLNWLTLGEREFLLQFSDAIEIIGTGNTQDACKNLNTTKTIIKNLEQLVIDQEVSRLKNAFFDSIPLNRLNQKTKYYITYIENAGELNKYLSKYEYIKDIKNNFEEIVSNKDLPIFINDFLYWLSIDIDKLWKELYEKLFKNERNKEIISLRARGETLEAAGERYGLTRERVRQIEAKILDKFTEFNEKYNPLLLILGDNGFEIYVKKEHVEKYVSAYGTEFCYLMENSINESYKYDKEKGLFILNGDNDAVFLKDFVSSLSDEIWDTKLESIAKDVCNMFSISKTTFYQEIENQYNKTGKMYHRNRLTLTKIYEYILKKYYPKGIKLFDDKEREIFINHVRENFGEVKIPKNGRAIDARVADVAILCDRGTYIHKDYLILPNWLIEKIDDYIETSDRTVFSFLELFDTFKDELKENSNICNRYYLQGALKYYCKNKYFFSRDHISKDKNVSFEYEIDKFIKEKGVVTKSELYKEFNGLTEAMLAQTIIRSNDIIACDIGKYEHSCTLEILNKDRQIKKRIEQLCKERIISSRKLMEIMEEENQEFLQRNNIKNHYKLFSVLKYMFYEDFNFSRPFIANLEEKDTSKVVVLKKFLAGFDYIKISDVLEFCKQNKLKFQSTKAMLKMIEDDFIRVDKDGLMPIEMLKITKQDINDIRDVLFSKMEGNKYISSRKIDSFEDFKDIGIDWTGFLLDSIVKRYIYDIVAIGITTTDIYKLSTIYLSKELKIYTYEEFLRWVIKARHKKQKFKDIKEIKSFLEEEQLINSEIQRFVFEKGYIKKDEQGNIIVT